MMMRSELVMEASERASESECSQSRQGLAATGYWLSSPASPGSKPCPATARNLTCLL